jgi:hypothetical protein
MKSDSIYYYKVFGVEIKSTIILNQLIEIDPVPDCHISVVKDKISRPELCESHPKLNFPDIFRSKNYFYLELNQIAKYEIVKENSKTKICVEVLDDSSMNDVYAWFYGSILTAILQMNDIFPLHASAIQKDNQLFLFSGKSGIGKSTLAINLFSKGYEILTDDKCVLGFDDLTQEFIFQPSVQVVRLWKDAIDRLDTLEQLEEKTPVSNKLDKYQFSMKNLLRNKKKVSVHSINIIRNSPNIKQLKIKPVEGKSKLKLLNQQTHRNINLLDFEKVQSHWNYINLLAKHCSLNLIIRPESTDANEFADYVEQNIINPGVKE